MPQYNLYMDNNPGIGRIAIAKKNESSVWRVLGWYRIDAVSRKPFYDPIIKRTAHRENIQRPGKTGLVSVASSYPADTLGLIVREGFPSLDMAIAISLAHLMPENLDQIVLYTHHRRHLNAEGTQPGMSNEIAKEIIEQYSPTVVYDFVGISDTKPLVPTEWFSEFKQDTLAYNGPVNGDLLHDIAFNKIGQLAGRAAMGIFGNPTWDMGNYAEVMWTSNWGRRHARALLEAASLGKILLPENFHGFKFPASLLEQQRLVKRGSCLDGITIPSVPEEDLFDSVVSLWLELSEQREAPLLSLPHSDEQIAKVAAKIVGYAKENGIDHMIDAALSGVPIQDIVT